MRILLDECAPRPLKRELVEYDIRSVIEMGWSGKKNGELLQRVRCCGCGAVFTLATQFSLQS